jgi:hypothetical protein
VRYSYMDRVYISKNRFVVKQEVKKQLTAVAVTAILVAVGLIPACYLAISAAAGVVCLIR